MTISVIDYSTASDPLAAMKAAAAERRARLYGASQRPVVLAEASPVPKIDLAAQRGSWVARDLETLIRMARAGHSRRATAARLGRSIGSVIHQARRQGIVFTYANGPKERLQALAKEASRNCRLVFEKMPQNIPTHGKAAWIIASCAADHGFTVAELKSSGRTAPLARARHQAVWLVARETSLSIASISRAFGRDRSTIEDSIRLENGRQGADVRGLGSAQ